MKTLKPIQKIFHSKDLNIAYEKGIQEERARWKKKIEDNKEAIHPSIYRELLGEKE